ncbi:hypothetical protein [Rhodobaculum claviforme]|uniref:hypothetical protein n=1 Tax=Rhodobaculum claviforme TaxID=1549854 RepID=UPI00191466F7|nr:hypothetical protein [Rhodobaculum claviforme]
MTAQLLCEHDEQLILKAEFGQDELHPLELGRGSDIGPIKIPLIHLNRLAQGGSISCQLDAITELPAMKGIGFGPRAWPARRIYSAPRTSR